MQRNFWTLLVILSLCGCASNRPDRSGEVKPTQNVAPTAPRGFVFSFYLNASGIDNKPQDAFLMDTNRMMGVRTNHRDSKGNWHPLNALAQLEPPDYDTLSSIIFKNDLIDIDSTDLTEQCAPDEIISLGIIPTEGHKMLHVTFDACAADYNLLLQPQRRGFKELMEWFERMRVKYRPSQPD